MLEFATATGGITVVVLVWSSVLRTTVIPRRTSSRTARWAARATGVLFAAVAARLPGTPRQWVMELCGPAGFLVMAAGWLVALAAGFALLAIAVGGFPTALAVTGAVSAALVVAAFAVHLGIVLGCYRDRERLVSLAGSRMRVVTDADMTVAEHLRAGTRGELDDYFASWAGWVADVHDSHTGYPGLVYLRSVGDLPWSKAVLLVLDVAALVEAFAPRWAPAHTRVLLDSGSMCVQDLAARMGIHVPAAAISLHDREAHAFADTMRLVAASGFDVVKDIDLACEAFQRNRVRYAPHATLIGARLLIRSHENLGVAS